MRLPSVGAATGSYFAERDRRASARAVADAIDTLLSADHFDAASCAWLADRQRFADSARLLRLKFQTGRSDWPDPLAIFLDRRNGRVRAFRLALEFHAVVLPLPSTRRDEFTTSDLRKIARSKIKRRTRGAREALAALGFINWKSATRRERAAFALAELCRLRLAGVE